MKTPKTPAGKAFIERFTQWSATPEIQEANRRAKEALDAYLDSDECAELKAQEARARADWQARHNEPFPTSLESILRLGIRAGASVDFILDSPPAEVLAVVEGYMARVKDMQGATAENDPPPRQHDDALDRLPDDSWCSPREFGKVIGLDLDGPQAARLKKALERFRQNHRVPAVGWREMPDAKGNEARYVFRVGDVRELVRKYAPG